MRRYPMLKLALSMLTLIVVTLGAIPGSASELSEQSLYNLEYLDENYNRYTDYANGYSIAIPQDMSVDNSLAAIRTVFANSTTDIAVYYDNFTATPTTTTDYTYYNNKFLANTADHSVLTDERFRLNGWTVHTLKWERRSLSR